MTWSLSPSRSRLANILLEGAGNVHLVDEAAVVNLGDLVSAM